MKCGDYGENGRYICGPKEHNSQHDAYYCSKCRKWLEDTCGDFGCEFCTGRPETAP